MRANNIHVPSEVMTDGIKDIRFLKTDNIAMDLYSYYICSAN